MRIYQFENSDPECDKDIVLMFLIGDNNFISGATSKQLGNRNLFNWRNNWEWLTRRNSYDNNFIVNNFSYKDDL